VNKDEYKKKENDYNVTVKTIINVRDQHFLLWYFVKLHNFCSIWRNYTCRPLSRILPILGWLNIFFCV